MPNDGGNGSPIGDDKIVKVRIGFWIWTVLIAFVFGGSILAYKLDMVKAKAETKECISVEAEKFETKVEMIYARKDMVETYQKMIIQRLDKIDKKLGM